jgi:hypothetical protein
MWIYLVLILAALVAASRVVIAIRKTRSLARDDWDARLVKNLRASGGNAFTPYEVDFFFNLPDEAACAALTNVLQAEGFAIDARIASGEAATGYSLHARKNIRVSVTEMQEYSERFRKLAALHGGFYDGWMSDPKRTP